MVKASRLNPPMIAFEGILTQQAAIRIVGKNVMDYEKTAKMAVSNFVLKESVKCRGRL